LATTFIGAADDSSIVREREQELAKAVTDKDKTELFALTDKDFHVRWTLGSLVLGDRTEEEDREHWIDNLTHLRIVEYEAVISRIWMQRDLASVTIEETWTIQSPRGRQLEKHLSTLDGWAKLQGTWKLVWRESR
jgi:hypothetical protein